jgi:hypothetical protein
VSSDAPLGPGGNRGLLIHHCAPMTTTGQARPHRSSDALLPDAPVASDEGLRETLERAFRASGW